MIIRNLIAISLFGLTPFIVIASEEWISEKESYVQNLLSDVQAQCGQNDCHNSRIGPRGPRGPRGFPGETGSTGATGAPAGSFD